MSDPAPNPPATSADSATNGEHSRQPAPVNEPGFGAQFLQFLKEEKKWWLTPIIISLAIIVLIALLMRSPAAPFIYPEQ